VNDLWPYSEARRRTAADRPRHQAKRSWRMGVELVLVVYGVVGNPDALGGLSTRKSGCGNLRECTDRLGLSVRSGLAGVQPAAAGLPGPPFSGDQIGRAHV